MNVGWKRKKLTKRLQTAGNRIFSAKKYEFAEWYCQKNVLDFG